MWQIRFARSSIGTHAILYVVGYDFHGLFSPFAFGKPGKAIINAKSIIPVYFSFIRFEYLDEYY
ncbi:hypothetical protein SFC43_25785 [Bacteroides sp. CR5/BHMF/2]|nr:hypothetical protein [Bacteroides sp. CR5/BHMF/2]